MRKNIFTKVMLSLSVGILFSVAISSVLPVSGEEHLYSDVIRLHVIAESDSGEDQRVKLAVRDSVLELTEENLCGVTDFDNAYELLSSMTDEIRKTAEERALAEGHHVSAEVIFDREEYPVRYYDDFALPAGEYMSMRIVLGEGEGKNWWCVLFPPLCSDAAKDDGGEESFYAAGFTPEEYKIIKKESGTKYKVRFRVLEILSETFGFDY